MTSIRKGRYSVIVPMYNEAPRVLGVIYPLTQCKKIKEIICVDDGSADNSYEKVKRYFPNVTLIRHVHNRGKTEAVRTGLQRVSEEHCILIDSDLVNLTTEDIEKALLLYETNRLDCLLLCGRPVNPLDSILRTCLRLAHVVTGNRIIKSRDLRAAIGSHLINRYQLETAQNEYLVKNKKRVAYTNISARNVWKIQKSGLFAGLKGDIVMWSQIFKYNQLSITTHRALFFAQQRL